MRPYGSRDDATPAAEVPLSLSQNQSLQDESELSVRRTLEETAPMRMKTDPMFAGGGVANMRTVAEMCIVRSERHHDHEHNSGPHRGS